MATFFNVDSGNHDQSMLCFARIMDCSHSQQHDVDFFKFDGIGSLSARRDGSNFAQDFARMMEFLAELRERNREIWINLSTGTWPSPFWLQHADCVWRRGHDHYFQHAEAACKTRNCNRGPPRERWITYRDTQVRSGSNFGRSHD